MDDLISRSALTEELKDWRGDKEDVDRDDPHDVGYYAAMSRAIRIADKVPTIDAVPKWISVEERLPEDDGEYLVLKVHNYRKDDGWMAQEVALFLRTRDPEWVIGNLCEVTHWMPLPEPPIK